MCNTIGSSEHRHTHMRTLRKSLAQLTSEFDNYNVNICY